MLNTNHTPTHTHTCTHICTHVHAHKCTHIHKCTTNKVLYSMYTVIRKCRRKSITVSRRVIVSAQNTQIKEENRKLLTVNSIIPDVVQAGKGRVSGYYHELYTQMSPSHWTPLVM